MAQGVTGVGVRPAGDPSILHGARQPTSSAVRVASPPLKDRHPLGKEEGAACAAARGEQSVQNTARR